MGEYVHKVIQSSIEGKRKNSPGKISSVKIIKDFSACRALSDVNKPVGPYKASHHLLFLSFQGILG